MDFGYQGLFDTQWAFEKAQIITAGAGAKAHDAEKPLMLATNTTSVCVLPVSRTLPDTFWATAQSPGTAAPNDAVLVEKVRACAGSGFPTIVSFHWGQELSGQATEIQLELARKLIDAGALAVIGHHPHVVQQVRFYRGRPIVPSLGNFFFQTHSKRQTSGMAAQFRFQTTGVSLQLLPLVVSNGAQFLKPRLLTKSDKDPLQIAAGSPCRVADSQSRRRICTISYPLVPVAAGPSQPGKVL
jgi:poly-gamma-glutamate synthesis protein (capsule biosynthesis protein)